MTATCFIAGISAALASGLLLVGFFRIACNLDRPAICITCCVIGGVELFSGAWIWTGLLAIMGGWI